jgi:hypothetical protein
MLHVLLASPPLEPCKQYSRRSSSASGETAKPWFRNIRRSASRQPSSASFSPKSLSHHTNHSHSAAAERRCVINRSRESCFHPSRPRRPKHANRLVVICAVSLFLSMVQVVVVEGVLCECCTRAAPSNTKKVVAETDNSPLLAMATATATNLPTPRLLGGLALLGCDEKWLVGR